MGNCEKSYNIFSSLLWFKVKIYPPLLNFRQLYELLVAFLISAVITGIILVSMILICYGIVIKKYRMLYYL